MEHGEANGGINLNFSLQIRQKWIIKLITAGPLYDFISSTLFSVYE
jgi:hypothetical protein